MDSFSLAAHLGGQGRALLQEYQQTGETDYLDASIDLARRALENASVHERPIYLNDLGYRLRERFEACRSIGDISEAIELVEQSSQTIGNRSLRAIVLNNLATFLGDRFEWSQEIDDLERGLTAANHALDLSGSNVAFQAECKNTLCLIYGYRYSKLGNVEDLETATRMAHEAVEMINPDDANLPMFMGNLGVCYERRFERRGNPADIDKAVDYAQRTVDSTNPDDLAEDTGSPTERSLYLKNLSNALALRFTVSNNLQDMEHAIDHGIDAANLIPGHPRWPELLHNVSLLLEDRFMRLGDITDLDEGIGLEEAAASGIAAEDPRLLTHWDQLGVLYARKFDCGDEMTDLERSMELAQKVLDASDGDNHDVHDMARYKWHMALVLNRRFECLDEVADLDRAILLGTEALDGIAPNDPRRIELLLDVGDFQSSKYMKSGLAEHFQFATTLTQEAMDVPHLFDRPLQMCAISCRFKERYAFTRNESDIQRSIELAQKAVSLVAMEHPHSSYCLWHLSLAIETRYRVLGSLSDLERAIQINQNALAAISLDRLDQTQMLYTLSVQLTHRYEQMGALVDLEEAIHLMQGSKDNVPTNSQVGRVLCLKSLGDQLGYLFERNADMSTLTEAIDVANEASKLYTDEDIVRASILNSLGLLFKSRFRITSLQDDLIAAIDVQREALRILPGEDPDRSIVIYNLGVSLADLCRRSSERRDIAEAIGIAWQAVNAAPESHPNRAMYLDAVGMLLEEYSDDGGHILAKARAPVDMFTEALHHEESPPLDRIKAGQNAFHYYVRHEEWSAASSVATDVVKLFPLLVPRWMSRADQQHLLKNISHFTSLAASAVLQVNGLPSNALQILEAGRGVIAGLTTDLKVDISALEESEAALYEEYTKLRRRILLPIASSLSKVTETAQTLSTRKGSRKSRSGPSRIIAAGPERTEYLKTLEDLESRIRAVPGFEHFLQRQSEHDYISLAESGPIVAFNVTEHRSDAILITRTKITSIRLETLHFRDMKGYIPKVVGKTQLSKGMPSTKKQRNQELQNILQWLWDTAVLPVLTELRLQARSGDSDAALPRIWWMASGYMGLFPMHAAGDAKGMAAMDYVISSYLPTLQVLRFSRTRRGQQLQDPNLKMLVVPAPAKAGQEDLNTEAEVQAIKEGLKDIASYTVLDRPSRVNVLQELPSSHLLHFSCHGKSHPTDPSNSALELSPTAENSADSLLTVKDLAAINHDRAQLAYLSACSTAENSSEDLLDEVIHVASAFQLIGFAHVIGTLWEISDRAAVPVSRLFYAELGRRMAAGEDLDGIVAYALHEALQQHRNTKRIMRSHDVLAWAPFIHMGV